jgi:adenylylsulfate kinase
MVERVPGFAIWLTGLPSSGKTVIAKKMSLLLSKRDISTQILDSDELRQKLTPRPTYSPEERDWFYEIVTFLAELLTENGVNVLIAATAPHRVYRNAARSRISRFAEVYVDCPEEVCRKRDPKGLWDQANKGKIATLPGVGVLYEPPVSPEVHVDTANFSIEEAAQQTLNELGKQGLF